METRKYSLTVVLASDLSGTEAKQVNERITEAVEKLGGKLGKVESLGIKSLAYSIKGESQASFGKFEFDLSPEKVNPLKSELEKMRKFLRIMIDHA